MYDEGTLQCTCVDPDGMPRLAAEMSPVESGHQAILTASGEKVQVLRDTATFLDQSVRYSSAVMPTLGTAIWGCSDGLHRHAKGIGDQDIKG